MSIELVRLKDVDSIEPMVTANVELCKTQRNLLTARHMIGFLRDYDAMPSATESAEQKYARAYESLKASVDIDEQNGNDAFFTVMRREGRLARATFIGFASRLRSQQPQRLRLPLPVALLERFPPAIENYPVSTKLTAFVSSPVKRTQRLELVTAYDGLMASLDTGEPAWTIEPDHRLRPIQLAISGAGLTRHGDGKPCLYNDGAARWSLPLAAHLYVNEAMRGTLAAGEQKQAVA